MGGRCWTGRDPNTSPSAGTGDVGLDSCFFSPFRLYAGLGAGWVSAGVGAGPAFAASPAVVACLDFGASVAFAAEVAAAAVDGSTCWVMVADWGTATIAIDDLATRSIVADFAGADAGMVAISISGLGPIAKPSAAVTGLGTESLPIFPSYAFINYC
jgi:hypothetical protein